MSSVSLSERATPSSAFHWSCSTSSGRVGNLGGTVLYVVVVVVYCPPFLKTNLVLGRKLVFPTSHTRTNYRLNLK